MNYINRIWILLLVSLTFSCSKDLGNYDYSKVNDIEITGLLDGDHHTSRIYNLAFGDTLSLHPTIKGSISGSSLNNLEFEWKVNDQVVSKNESIKYIADKDYGKLNAEFTVLDKSTTIKKSYSFFVNVVNQNKLGYYVLSKKINADAVLYCKSSLQENSTFKEVKLSAVGDLGKNPIYISGSKKYGASSTDYYNQITLGVQKAKYPVILIDSREFLPNILYSTDSYTGDKSNFIFEPSDIISDPYNPIVYATVNGKIHILQKGGISTARLENDPLDYQVGNGAVALPRGNGAYFISFFDSKNNKIRVADNSLGGFAYNYNRLFDNIIPDNLNQGQSFLCGSAANINGLNYVYLLRKDNKLISYVLNYSDDDLPSNIQELAQGAVPENGVISQSIFNTSNNSWYISVGKKIYRSSYLGLNFQTEIELPANSKGVISKFHYDVSANKILISTYDTSYSGEKKSSIYIYNTLDNKLEYSAEYVVEEVAGLYIGI